MSGIEVRKTVHIEQPSMLEEAFLRAVSYVSNDADLLWEYVRYGSQRQYYFDSRGIADSGYVPPAAEIRCSRDNGATWQVLGPWKVRENISGPRFLDIGGPNWILHPKTGALLCVYCANESIDGLLPWDEGSPVSSTRRVFCKASYDQGASWSEPEQLVMSNPGCDETNWVPGVTFGKNSGMVEAFSATWLDEENFLIPFMIQSIEGDKLSHQWKSAVIRGTWKGDAAEPLWQCGGYVTVGKDGSNCGGEEPWLALLPDGRLLMSMRVRVDAGDGTTIPSGKFYAVSSDQGQTWSKPELMRYDDGSQVYTPANFAHVFVSRKNGRLYLITNILDEPTTGCDPRTVLQIAEMDMNTFAVIRDSVTVIQQRDIEAGEPETIRFSNWVCYEDRPTGDLVLFMTGCPGNVGRHEECRVPPHAFRYDITLPG